MGWTSFPDQSHLAPPSGFGQSSHFLPRRFMRMDEGKKDGRTVPSWEGEFHHSEVPTKEAGGVELQAKGLEASSWPTGNTATPRAGKAEPARKGLSYEFTHPAGCLANSGNRCCGLRKTGLRKSPRNSSQDYLWSDNGSVTRASRVAQWTRMLAPKPMTQNPRDERREPAPQSCPLTPTYMPWRSPSPDTYHTCIFAKFEKKQTSREELATLTV